MSKSIHVLFLHGSNGGPTDSTATHLATWFNTVIPSLPVSDYASCLNLVSAVLETFQPDVVVGESFGAALAYDLISTGKWKGPTILLCPAIIKVKQSLGKMSTTSHDLQFPKGLPLIVVHGKQDTVISRQDIQAIAEASDKKHTQIIMVDDDHNMRRIVNGKDSIQLHDLVKDIMTNTRVHNGG